MINADSLEALHRILAADRRPWPRFNTTSEMELAEFEFPHGATEVKEIEAIASSLGFEANHASSLRESKTSATDLIVLVIQYGGAAFLALNAFVKAANELPENVRKLREKLKPYFSQASLLSPALQLEVLHRWLNARYGERQWRYDPDQLEAKPAGELLVFRFTEEKSGNGHVLAVQGDEVQELSSQFFLTR